MAEFVMRQLAEDAGLGKAIETASAAVSSEEIGNDMYPPAKRILTAKGVPFSRRSARRMSPADYAQYDYIVCMDRSNLRWLRHIIGEDVDGKVSLMMQWDGQDRDVADPWYTGDFETAYADIEAGCKGMLWRLMGEKSDK